MPTQDELRRRRTNAASRIQDTQGGAFSNTGVAGGSFLALPPEENPAYQAALDKGRPKRSGYTMIQTPSGGSMAVPVGQERKYTDILYKGSPVADTGFQRPTPEAAYALGATGVVPTGNTPYERSFRMGSNVEGPVQQPTPSFGYQVGQLATNVPGAIGSFAQNAASRIGGFFGGGTPAATAYGVGVSTGTPPPPPMTPPAGINNLVAPPPLPSALQTVQAMQQQPPRRYSDLGYY